jgi:osmoprotectant transport system permease protein
MDFLLQVVRWFADPVHWQGDFGIPNRLLEHVGMSAAATLASAAVALPVGVLLGHRGRGGTLAINVSNVGRAVPSFAVLVFALELFGIGAAPAFIALVALGVPPIVTNSYVGLREVDPDVREAARGMGLNGAQILFGVELPLALPLIMAGVRTTTVNIVATATLAALVAWGGLGRYIIDGFAQQDYPQVFAGALLVALLAMVTELSLAGLQYLVTPEGLRRFRQTAARAQAA